jgi:predicted amidohydrolase YtcJ
MKQKWMIVLSVAAFATAVLTAGCDKPQPPAQPQVDAADTIYVSGDIVTVDDQQPAAEALAVKGGKIFAVGTRADVEKAHKGPSTAMVDLGGKALLPGFLDAHSHYVSSLTVANQDRATSSGFPSLIRQVETLRQVHYPASHV